MKEETKKRKFKKCTYPGVPSNRYLISNDGEIYDTMYDKYVPLHEDKDGYYMCSINSKTFRMNRLVAYDWCLKNRDLKLVVDHVDGNKKNNYYKNLEWVTSKENTHRAEKMGLRNVRGENSSTNKYPEEFIHDICRLFVQGKTNMDIWRTFRKKDRIDPKDPDDYSLYILIHHLRHKTIWPDVVSKYDYPTSSKSEKIFRPKEGKSRFNEDQVHQVCKMYVDGKSTNDIADSFGYDKKNDPVTYKLVTDQIRRITTGENWRYISEKYFESRVGKSGRTRYNIDDDKLSDMLDKHYPLERILQEFDIEHAENPKLKRRAIVRRIRNYKVNNELGEEIILTSNDLGNIYGEAAQ